SDSISESILSCIILIKCPIFVGHYKEYVLLLPKERFKEMLNPTVSLCIEIIPNCLNNLMTKIPQEYTAKVRLDQSVASFAHSPLGNF
ncbi:hypothetical protein L2821_09720, partial [Lactobacillus gasseri]|nr:hypothetical protein [Lactobacillus gasseri]MCZ3555268.1 hypothetical protein [Lactobacillus gasseri]MCZ3934078.1 hypothetical protein [Lactobacillus gasseri]MCZ3935871.1 hypothetical protein [Lactobacillus gasseri]MCZ3937681.1 hypothetical protein [Lactobacillus gasseri]